MRAPQERRIDYVTIDDGPLRLTAEFPEVAALDQPHGQLAGVVTITNVGTSQLAVSTGMHADMELTQDGRVMTDSIPQRVDINFLLPAGASHQQEAYVNLWRSIPRGRAAPGHYQLYAKQQFHVTSASDHESHPVVGPNATVIDIRAGPWEIELREP